MPHACIDVGSNTTRLLVADAEDGVRPLLERRAFTRIGSSVSRDGLIPARKIDETAEVVAAYAALAREHGCATIVAVATAAVRQAPNRAELRREVEARAGLVVRILSPAEEARLAFAGATSALSAGGSDRILVADVGGGSTEVVVGTVAGGSAWSRSCPIGSGTLADRLLRSDPPTAAELDAVRRRVAEALAELAPPPADHAFAVGGSATSLVRVVGQELGPAELERALHALTTSRVAELADRFELDRERVRLLRAGVLVFEGLSRRLGMVLEIGAGGLREGLVLELEALQS